MPNNPIDNSNTSDGTVTVTNVDHESGTITFNNSADLEGLWDYDPGDFDSSFCNPHNFPEGEVLEIIGFTIYLGDTFAPGLWAGREESEIRIGEKTYKVKSILMDRRAVELYPNNTVRCGDQIYL